MQTRVVVKHPETQVIILDQVFPTVGAAADGASAVMDQVPEKWRLTKICIGKLTSGYQRAKNNPREYMWIGPAEFQPIFAQSTEPPVIPATVTSTPPPANPLPRANPPERNEDLDDLLTFELVDFVNSKHTNDDIALFLLSQMTETIVDSISGHLLVKRPNGYWIDHGAMTDAIESLVPPVIQLVNDTVTDAMFNMESEPTTAPAAFLKAFERAIGLLKTKTSDSQKRRYVIKCMYDHSPRVNVQAKRDKWTTGTRNAQPDLKWMLPCADGLLDLRDGLSYRDGIADAYVTEWLTVKGSPDEADDVIEIDAKFHQLMLALFNGNYDHLRTFQTLIGYSLTGDTSQQKMFICYGAGSNGKSLFFGALRVMMRGLMGETSRDTIMSQRNGRSGPAPELIKMRGKRVITVTETTADQVVDEPLIKILSSGADEVLSARSLYSNTEVEFSLLCKVFMITNELPQFKISPSIVRRLVMIPFTAKFVDHPNPDVPTEHLINREIPDLLRTAPYQQGLLRWAVQGAQRYYEDHVVKHCPDDDENGEPRRLPLIIPTEWQYQLVEVMEDTDHVARFFTTLSQGGATTGGKLYAHYQAWCSRQGMKPVSNNKFPARFEQICHVNGIVIKKVHNVKTYLGLTVPEPQ